MHFSEVGKKSFTGPDKIKGGTKLRTHAMYTAYSINMWLERAITFKTNKNVKVQHNPKPQYI